ncbi:sex peptide receptor-like [Mytilus edulis]|uniref:sex peptide receptor-like n=1 Tax=Mytilus edulis TaxID=6550 RepID=UPI0039F13325
MTIADLCTGIFPLPLYIYFFSFGNYLEKVSVNWCVIYVYFEEYILAIFHTTSIWLTTTLAIQRYMFVYRSLNVRIREKCTMGKIVIVIVIILEDDFSPVNASSNIHPNDTIKICAITVNPWLLDNFKIYYNIYFWFRAIFIHLIPCLILLFINVLLIIKRLIAKGDK